MGLGGLHINVSQLLKEPSGAVRTYDVAESVTLGDEPHEVRGAVKLFRTSDGLWVTATLESTLACTCSLCLDEFAQTLELLIDEETESAGSLEEEESERLRIDDDILDLTEAVRQYLEMAPPMKPLCRPGCRGICPGCGRNLNDGTCACGSGPRDPRWGALLTMAATGADTEES
jgi:uncharacterized protein